MLRVFPVREDQTEFLASADQLENKGVLETLEHEDQEEPE